MNEPRTDLTQGALDLLVPQVTALFMLLIQDARLGSPCTCNECGGVVASA